MEVQDYIKLAYQATFGGGHLVTDARESFRRLQEEAAEAGKCGLKCSCENYDHGDADSWNSQGEEFTDDGTIAGQTDPFEYVGDNHSRLHLDRLNGRISLETVNCMFLDSASELTGTEEEFKEKMETVRQCCADKLLDISLEEFEKQYEDYLKQGIHAVHHSRSFNEKYHPAYRIVKNCYHHYFQAFEQIEQLLKESDQPVLKVAIDGRCAGGKSTLGNLLKNTYDCNLFHMDDFFLQPYQRTPERRAQAGGNVDYERFKTEVLDQIDAQKQTFDYQLYSCKHQQLTDFVSVEKKRLNIVEGSYSQHPYFGDCYDLRFFVDVSPELQLERIEKRNGKEMLENFKTMWIPMEEKYFSAYDVRSKSTVLISC